jgi:hypothetical protein
MTKRLLRMVHDASLPAVFEMSAAIQAAAHVTKDHQEAVTAFIAKLPSRLKANEALSSWSLRHACRENDRERKFGWLVHRSNDD